MMDQPPCKRALIVVEQGDRSARLVASLTNRERCAVAVTIDPTAELRKLGADMLARLLSEDGFDARVVVGARAALRDLPRLRAPSVLVLDVGRPGRGTQHVARRARALYPSLPVLLVTGDTEGSIESVAPPTLVLRKPVDYSELASALHALLRLAPGDGPDASEAARW